MLLIITIFVTIAYMVLIRDIWTGLVSVVIGQHLDKAQSNQVKHCGGVAILRPRSFEPRKADKFGLSHFLSVRRFWGSLLYNGLVSTLFSGSF